MKNGDVITIQRVENGWIVSGPPQEAPLVFVAVDSAMLLDHVTALCKLTNAAPDLAKQRPESFKAVTVT